MTITGALRVCANAPKLLVHVWRRTSKIASVSCVKTRKATVNNSIGLDHWNKSDWIFCCCVLIRPWLFTYLHSISIHRYRSPNLISQDKNHLHHHHNRQHHKYREKKTVTTRLSLSVTWMMCSDFPGDNQISTVCSMPILTLEREANTFLRIVGIRLRNDDASYARRKESSGRLCQNPRNSTRTGVVIVLQTEILQLYLSFYILRFMLMEEFLDWIPRHYFYKHLTLSALVCWIAELTIL